MTRSEQLGKAIRSTTEKLIDVRHETWNYTSADVETYELIQSVLLAEQNRSEGCAFCCYTEYPDATLYPREKSEFYAGRSRQVEVDEFDEDELDDVSFCPHCGRDLTEGESV